MLMNEATSFLQQIHPSPPWNFASNVIMVFLIYWRSSTENTEWQEILGNIFPLVNTLYKCKPSFIFPLKLFLEEKEGFMEEELVWIGNKSSMYDYM